MAKASSVADVRDTFKTQVTELQELAEKSAKASQLQEQREWIMPDKKDWDGNLFDLEGMSSPFDREENHQDFLQAITSPGVDGDLKASQLQGDWLGSLERSFRARHTTRVQAEMHMASRLFGHGHEKGLFQGGVMEYLKGIVKNAKKKAP